jgi:hypothetical protein
MESAGSGMECLAVVAASHKWRPSAEGAGGTLQRGVECAGGGLQLGTLPTAAERQHVSAVMRPPWHGDASERSGVGKREVDTATSNTTLGRRMAQATC